MGKFSYRLGGGGILGVKTFSALLLLTIKVNKTVAYIPKKKKKEYKNKWMLWIFTVYEKTIFTKI